jgi:hypothetical protein
VRRQRIGVRSALGGIRVHDELAVPIRVRERGQGVEHGFVRRGTHTRLVIQIDLAVTEIALHAMPVFGDEMPAAGVERTPFAPTTRCVAAQAQIAHRRSILLATVLLTPEQRMRMAGPSYCVVGATTVAMYS